MFKAKVIFFTCLGILLLLLGFIGIFLPILPTTPFVIAAAGCLSYTPKLRARILNISFFKEYFCNYKNKSGISKKTVISSLIFLWVALLVSICFIKAWWAFFLLMAVGITVTVHILIVSRPKP